MSFSELLIAGRWLLGIVLIMAAVGKLSAKGRDSTVEALANYRVLPRSLNRPVAVMLPWAEIVLACLLVAGAVVTVAAACTAVLLGMFAAVVGWHVLHGRRFACGCGGADLISWNLAGRDAALSALAILVAFGPNGGLAIWPGWDATPSSTPVLLLIPMPLLVIVAAIAARLLQEAAFVFRTTTVSMPKEKF
jgi:uncharacterized membrane protein YphA (DoxX/SURF4 family)